MCSGLSVNTSIDMNTSSFSISFVYETDRLTDTDNRLVVAKGKGVQERVGLGVCDYQMQTIYKGWINNKVLMYSTENYIQYTVINHNGKEYRKRMCVISESVISHSVVSDSL